MILTNSIPEFFFLLFNLQILHSLGNVIHWNIWDPFVRCYPHRTITAGYQWLHHLVISICTDNMSWFIHWQGRPFPSKWSWVAMTRSLAQQTIGSMQETLKHPPSQHNTFACFSNSLASVMTLRLGWRPQVHQMNDILAIMYIICLQLRARVWYTNEPNQSIRVFPCFITFKLRNMTSCWGRWTLDHQNITDPCNFHVSLKFILELKFTRCKIHLELRIGPIFGWH